jgi:hypothetical protein
MVFLFHIQWFRAVPFRERRKKHSMWRDFPHLFILAAGEGGWGKKENTAKKSVEIGF